MPRAVESATPIRCCDCDDEVDTVSAITEKMSLTSATVRAIGQITDSPAGSARSSGTVLGDGLSPTTPQHDAGMRIEPPMSVPTPAAASPAATAAPLPPVDPPGVKPSRQGLLVAGKMALVVPTAAASSGRLVLPRTAPPAVRSRAMATMSSLATRSRHTALPSVQGMPATGRLSLIARVMPASGPWPAWAPLSTWMYACRRGSKRSMALRCALTTSCGSSSPAADRPAISSAGIQASELTSTGATVARSARLMPNGSNSARRGTCLAPNGWIRDGLSLTVIDAHWMAVARGDEPADLVLAGGHVLSVFTKEWLDVDVAVKDGHVVGLGRYDGGERLDVSGAYLVPGFIDAHMHIESSKLMVDEFARAVLAHGTTAVVADPHEIANVLGTDGIHWLLDCCTALPLDGFVMASSCVPASRFESPRRPFTPGDMESLLRRSRTIGVAEMMNFPGVIAGRESELRKLTTGLTDHVDGHAPGVRGPQLNAYIAAGIRSDHEATYFEAALEKRRLGMWVLLREASIARNLRDLLPLVRQYGTDCCAFCTDDREPDFIVEEGHIDQMVRVAVEEGVAPEDAIVMATINA